MNKQDLIERANLINVQIEQTKQQFTTLTAHLSECNFWLGKIEELEKQVESDKVSETTSENADGEANSESTEQTAEQ